MPEICKQTKICIVYILCVLGGGGLEEMQNKNKKPKDRKVKWFLNKLKLKQPLNSLVKLLSDGV